MCRYVKIHAPIRIAYISDDDDDDDNDDDDDDNDRVLAITPSRRSPPETMDL